MKTRKGEGVVVRVDSRIMTVMEIDFGLGVQMEWLPEHIQVISVKDVREAENPAEVQVEEQLPSWLARLKPNGTFTAHRESSALEASVKSSIRAGDMTNRQAVKQVACLLGQGF